MTVPSGLPAGTDHLIVWADYLGQVAETSESDNSYQVPITVNSSPPPPALTVFLMSDTGASSSDGITSDPEISGTGLANVVVTISEGGNVLGTTTSDGSGDWSFTPSLADGDHTLVASETNSGVIGTASVTFTLDTTRPTVSAVPPLTVAGNSGATAIGIPAPSDNLSSSRSR